MGMCERVSNSRESAWLANPCKLRIRPAGRPAPQNIKKACEHLERPKADSRSVHLSLNRILAKVWSADAKQTVRLSADQTLASILSDSREFVSFAKPCESRIAIPDPNLSGNGFCLPRRLPRWRKSAPQLVVHRACHQPELLGVHHQGPNLSGNCLFSTGTG